MTTVREATPADGPAIARVQTETWRVAYAGLLPAHVLAALDPVERGEVWSRRLAEGLEPGQATFVAEAGAEVVGFASVGAWRDDDAAEGELYALYVLPERWDTGTGRLLLERAEASLRASGWERACLWVLAGNERAERFYRRAGWADDGVEKVEDFGGAEARERRYSKRL